MRAGPVCTLHEKAAQLFGIFVLPISHVVASLILHVRLSISNTLEAPP